MKRYLCFGLCLAFLLLLGTPAAAQPEYLSLEDWLRANWNLGESDVILDKGCEMDRTVWNVPRQIPTRGKTVCQVWRRGTGDKLLTYKNGEPAKWTDDEWSQTVTEPKTIAKDGRFMVRKAEREGPKEDILRWVFPGRQ